MLRVTYDDNWRIERHILRFPLKYERGHTEFEMLCARQILFERGLYGESLDKLDDLHHK